MTCDPTGMRVFAIGDLHLPGGDRKPMDIFGAHWANHFDKIRADWRARVSEDDLVLIPGDISWAMRLEDAQVDIDAIGALPGRKVLLRGNHDYWWSSISRVRAALPEGTYALQNDALAFGDMIICGTRGWVCPGMPSFGEDDVHIYSREVSRLSLSLEAAQKLQLAREAEGGDPRLITMVHYPPFADATQPTEVTSLLAEYGVRDVVYGHLHGQGLQGAYSGPIGEVRYHLTSCDGLDFKLLELP